MIDTLRNLEDKGYLKDEDIVECVEATQGAKRHVDKDQRYKILKKGRKCYVETNTGIMPCSFFTYSKFRIVSEPSISLEDILG